MKREKAIRFSEYGLQSRDTRRSLGIFDRKLRHRNAARRNIRRVENIVLVLPRIAGVCKRVSRNWRVDIDRLQMAFSILMSNRK